jgi:hypothetical protein
MMVSTVRCFELCRWEKIRRDLVEVPIIPGEISCWRSWKVSNRALRLQVEGLLKLIKGEVWLRNYEIGKLLICKVSRAEKFSAGPCPNRSRLLTLKLRMRDYRNIGIGCLDKLLGFIGKRRQKQGSRFAISSPIVVRRRLSGGRAFYLGWSRRLWKFDVYPIASCESAEGRY